MKKNIVILCFDTFGDITLRQPLFSGLLEQGYEVTVIVRKSYDQLITHLDSRLKVITTEAHAYQVPTKQTFIHIEVLQKIITWIKPDIMVCPLYNHTHLDEWIFRLFPNVHRIGFSNPSLPESLLDKLPPVENCSPFPTGHFFDQQATCNELDHEIIKSQALFKIITDSELSSYFPAITLPMELEQEIKDLLKNLDLKSNRYVLGCPAGAANIQIKSWPIDDYVEHIVYLYKKHNLPVLLTGIESERPYLNSIAEKAAQKNIKVYQWIGAQQDLKLLLGLIAHSCLYLGSDTGTMHFASALNVPIIVQFGGGHWPRFLPIAKRSFVATQKLPCFGCGWQCWLDYPACIKLVNPQKIQEGIDWILSDAKDENRIDLGQPLNSVVNKLTVGDSHCKQTYETDQGSLVTNQN